MKIFRIILFIVGIGLIVFGLIQAFVPETVFKLGPLEVEDQEGLNSQTLIIIGIGVFALIIGGLIKNKPN